jgi:hypothetical protein
MCLVQEELEELVALMFLVYLEDLVVPIQVYLEDLVVPFLVYLEASSLHLAHLVSNLEAQVHFQLMGLFVPEW